MAVKFFDADALPGPSNGAAAIEFATGAQPKTDIINLSWDLGIGSFALEKAIEKACDAGALVVIAAGNSGTDNDRARAIPAHYRTIRPEQIITVMATDRYNEKASFSNYGAATVDLAAPGVDIVTTRASLSKASKNDLTRNPFYRRHVSYNGTSAAAALVSGAAALLKSLEPKLTACELKVRLCESVRKMPGLKSKCVSGGILDLSWLP
jgi:subtilisin family serine protease